MEQHLIDIFSETAYLILLGTTTAAMFFAMTAFHELQSHHLDGLLYAFLAVFFAAAHFVYLGTLPADSPINVANQPLGIWQWINLFFAPALIGLFLLFGIFRLMGSATHVGLVKVFFGLTLFCYLYMLGPNWPADVKAILTLVYSGAWLDLGVRTAS